jgi:hypothetical protein
MAQGPNGERNLNLWTRAAVTRSWGGCWYYNFRLGLVIERRPAATAIIVVGPKLDEMTMVASEHLTRIHRCKSRCHVCLGACQSGATLKRLETSKLTGTKSWLLCGTLRVEVKHNLHIKSGIQSRKTGETPEKVGNERSFS